MTKTSAIVVGGGIMGLATGCALAARGLDVTVLERFTVAHDWASSHGLSRAIRFEYGREEIYTRMVARSLDLWEALAQETGSQLYTETGVLALGELDDGHTLPGFEVMKAQGLPVERLTARECGRRFPQFIAEEFDAITYNPLGGMLHATACCQALTSRLRARGATLREGARVRRVEPIGDAGRVLLENGEALLADHVVVAAGPWAQTVLPGLALPVRVTRQQVAYFAGLPAEQFAPGVFPIYLAKMAHYGFPLHGPGWIKAGVHTFGEMVDPDAGYATSEDEIAAVRAFFRRVIPAASTAALATVDTCMYDVSPDEDFILDRHPGGPGVIIGSGFSGHGFKFGILIGEMLAALALGESPLCAMERFRLGRFGE